MRTLKAVAVVVALALVVSIIPSTAQADEGWLDSVEKGLEAAKKQKKPILIDFSAKW